MYNKEEKTTQMDNQSQPKRAVWKTLGLWLMAVIFILFGLLGGLLMPCGATLTCEKSDRACQISYRYSLRSPQIVKFGFSDVVNVQPKFMHAKTGGNVYGLQIVLKQGEEVIDEVPHAEEVAETVKTYLKKPVVSRLEFDPHSDLLNILGMLSIFFSGFLGILLASGIIRKKVPQKADSIDPQLISDLLS